MRIIYRSLQAAFIVLSVTLTSLPLFAQNAEREREEAEQARESNMPKIRPVSQQPVTEKTVQIAPPVIVNFTERASWDLAHPKTNFTMRNNEEKEDGHPFLPHPAVANPKSTEVGGTRGSTGGQAGNNEKATVNSPAPLLNFSGLAGDGSVIPPDIKLAVGLTYAMEVTNQSFTIYNKSNGSLVSTVDLGTFFNFTQTNSNFLTDPHVLYDAIHGRFLAVIDAIIVGNTGTFILAVSQTNDPTGNWYLYTITGANNDLTTSNDETLLDFPIMGYNQNWIVLTGDQFVSGANSTTDCIFVMDRASCYAGTLGTIKTFTDANSSQVSPAQTMDTTTLTEYLVQEYNGSAGQVQIGTITGAVGSPVYTMANAGVITATVSGTTQTWSDNPVQAKQQGSTALIDDDDPRFPTSEYINGSLWFAHTVFLPATTPTYSGADWWQINPSALTVTQFGRISDGSSFYYYPNIYANATGDAIVGYTVSSSSEYASAAYSFHAAADAANTMETLYTFKTGTSSYNPTSGQDNRWGDFSGTAVDPVDNSFWVADGWASTNNNWATQIAHVGSSTPIQSPPVANFQANATTSCTGIIQFTDLSTNTPTSWSWTFGDGGTSTVQNPTHTYLTNGNYTVTLKATNAYGNNTQTINSYITINEPAGPAAVGASHCGSGSFSLSATTSNPVKWYNAAGTVVSTSNPFVTPVLTQTTTYYVQDSVPLPYDTVGPKNNTVLGTGGDLAPNYGLNFNVLQAGTLESVYVNASAAGSVTIFIQNSSGTTVNTTTVNVPAGGSRVTLNFPLAVGTGYLINYSTTASVTLYRNNAGAVYPMTDANGIVSITGNSAAAAGYYYFFYDWYVTGAGCNSQATPVTATITSGITTSNVAITDVACNGGSNGSAVLTPSGGTPAYTYHWSNGQTTATLSGVVAGTYTVTVNDASGCSGTASEIITQPTALSISATAINSGCGAPNGSATASVSGGTASYTYLWSNSATTATISNLSAATYHVTVTDSHQCSATSSATVSSSGALNISTVPGPGSCSGGSTGSASVNISGGTAPFTYHWSNGNTTSSITGVAAGNYTVSVSDNTGCSGTSSITISTTALSLTSSLTNANCFNASTGSASVNVTSGSSPYSYAWNNGSTVSSISNLSAGTYYVTVTDARNCVALDSVTISQPTSITIFVSAVQPTCAGLSNGSATATATGGTPAYSYHWSTNTSGTSVSNLAPGAYSVTLTDANSCTSASNFTVSNPVPVSASIVADNDSCFGSADGNIQLTAAGGTGPYAYLWSNNSTTATVSNLAAGSYSVTITDVHNCSATVSASVSQPAQINISTSATETTSGQSTGTATVSNITGGVSPYTATWSNGQTGNTITGLTAGTYTVTVTDHNGCEATATATVNISVGIATVNTDLTFTVYPNPAKSEVTIDAGNLDKETTIVLEDILGQTLMAKVVTSTPVNIDLTNYSNGVYFIELRQGTKRSVKKFVISR